MYKRLIVLLFISAWTFQANAAEPRTALEESGWKALTSYEQQMGYLQQLVTSSSSVDMKTIGTSVSGRAIPALFFSADPVFASQRAEKPLVLIFCQQHGNEPSGKEAAMIVARKLLAEDAALLDKLDLILVPQVNPDGSETGVSAGPGPAFCRSNLTTMEAALTNMRKKISLRNFTRSAGPMTCPPKEAASDFIPPARSSAITGVRST